MLVVHFHPHGAIGLLADLGDGVDPGTSGAFFYSSRQLLANAAIAASRVGSKPCPCRPKYSAN